MSLGPAAKDVNCIRDVFEGLGQFKQNIHLDIDPSVPAWMCPPRRYSLPIADKLQTKLQSLVGQGIVSKVKVSKVKGVMPRFISNLVIREKPSGDLRICLDPQILNKALVKQKFPIPTMEEISCKVKDKKVFSVLD